MKHLFFMLLLFNIALISSAIVLEDIAVPYTLEDRDRLIRVESEQKELRNELNTRFESIDKRFKLLAVELGLVISYDSYRKIYYYLVRDFVGFNETEVLLRDYFVEDIECNGVNTPVYIVHRIYRNLKTNLIFKDSEKLAAFIEKLAQKSGKYIS